MTTKKLKPVELEAEKIQDGAKDTKRIFNRLKYKERKVDRLLKSVDKYQTYNILYTLGTMIGTSILGMALLRYYVNKRKKM